MFRRTLLATLAGGLGSVAGCGSIGGPGEQTSPAPSDPSATTDSGSPVGTTPIRTRTTGDPCAGEDSQGDRGESWEVRYVRAAGFELTTDPHTVALGDSLTVRMVNVSDDPLSTGVKRKFDVHRDAGNLAPEWESIYRFPDDAAFRDESVGHDPGEGFVWHFELAAEGMEYDPAFRVCDPLEPGSYRFVHWGAAGKRPLGARFDVVEEDR